MRATGADVVFDGAIERPSTLIRARLISRAHGDASKPGAVVDPLISMRHDGRTSADTRRTVRALVWANAPEADAARKTVKSLMRRTTDVTIPFYSPKP